MTNNPFQAPHVEIQQHSSHIDGNVGKVASGQKMFIYGILSYFCAIFLQFIIGPIAAVLLLVMLVLGIIGIIRLSGGLGYGVLSVILISVSMIVPVVGLIVLLIVNSKATKYLRENGYKVGLLGATKIQ
jgi:hypothetical protein